MHACQKPEAAWCMIAEQTTAVDVPTTLESLDTDCKRAIAKMLSPPEKLALGAVTSTH